MKSRDSRLAFSLLFLRWTVFVVMAVWTVDKFVRPEHSATVFGGFYGLEGWGEVAIRIVGGAEALLLLAFVAGFAKRWTYGAVLVLHAISTLSAYKQYLAPFEGPNLLFFAAWPMLAACVTLFLLREEDTLLAVGGATKS
ncbi:MAG: hypothetical protein K8J08_22325 [Thermoanaerobaculia bacterium]|nr:hypothetical protein [Thermoanaerobaculia bacterium]